MDDNSSSEESEYPILAIRDMEEGPDGKQKVLVEWLG